MDSHARSSSDLSKDSIKESPQSNHDNEPASLSNDSQIDWQHLTFETSLPIPIGRQQIPSPDLKQYTSPFDWSESRKTFITWLSCAATSVTAYTAGSYAPAVPQLVEEWHISEVAALVGITIFTCGFAVAPMFLAPFSEINGRRPVFVVTGLLFVIFQLLCAVTPTFAGMLVARFLGGCMSSTFSTMVGGVVSDIYHADARNSAMSLFSGAALFGTGIGPLVSSIIAQHTTWRWIFYLQTIVCGILMAGVVIFFKETRGSVLLSKKAHALNTWYTQLEDAGYYGCVTGEASIEKRIGNTAEPSPHFIAGSRRVQRIRWKVAADEERTSIKRMIGISLYRPFHLLVTEPTVFFFSLWISFSWAVLYLTFAAVPLVFETVYTFDMQQQGAVFAAISVAAVISTVVSIYQEKWARKHLPEKRRQIFDRPEGRLYFSCVQSALLPIGCFWFGWSSFSTVHWIVPTLAIGCATMGIFSIYLAVFNYLADTYHRYASSALAAQSFCRNMLGGAFPLFTQAMFLKMTFQGAGSFLGGFAALLTIVPWILLIWGPTIRKRSKFASEIMNTR